MIDLELSGQTELLIKHLEKLRKKAVQEQPTDDLKKYWNYYSGDKEDGKSEDGKSEPTNRYNIIKGIVDTKCTLILDNEIISTVMPRLKTFVDTQGLALQNDIADILRDINAFVLDHNNFEKIKSEVVLNKLVYGVGFSETVWEQDDDEKLGDIKINALNPINCYPDASAKNVQDCNYFFYKESFSPITLKKKYPEYAKKMQTTIEENKQSSDKDPTGIITLGNNSNTTQAYTYGDSNGFKDNQKNITVWKCYLKDDSTFQAQETDDSAENGEAELKFKYPNGRLIVYVDGAKDYILEDKAIDYPFGFPIDSFSSSTISIWGNSSVKYLIDMQNRVNKAWERARYLVAAYLSLVTVDGHTMLEPEDLINQTIIKVENLNEGSFGQVSNNTLSELKELREYIQDLKNNTYEIARVNPTMISGERPEGVNSGEQVVQLAQSPMLAIKEEQRHFKYFICEQGEKNIVLMQLFYNTPRMIRLTDSKQVAEIPAQIDTQDPANAGLQQQPIQIHEQKQDPEKGIYYEAIRQIQGDLSIGEYDMQVVAGTEMPRSRTEKAQLTLQLAQQGYLGDDKIDIAERVLTALDFPQRYQIIDKMREDADAMSKNPPPEPPTDKITVAFKDLPQAAQGEWLQQHGFPQAASLLLNQQTQNIDHLQKLKELVQ